MLNDEVTEAIRDGKFHLWAVKSIDEGLEVLTGRPAGEADADGNFPKGTINFLVSRRLDELGEHLRRFAPGRGEREGAPRDEAEREPVSEPERTDR
jgi:hypothetical protein